MLNEYIDQTTCDEEQSMVVLSNQHRLCNDLEYVINMPDLCDVMFLVGPQNTPVYGVRAILASRSRAFYHFIISRRPEVNKSNKKRSFVKRMLFKIRRTFQGKLMETEHSQISQKLTIEVKDFDADTFRGLMRYIHCGAVKFHSNSVVGLLNAAHIFDLVDLRCACWTFALACIRPDTIRDLLTSSKIYSDFEQTDLLMQRIMTRVNGCPDVVEYSPEVKRQLLRELSEVTSHN